MNIHQSKHVLVIEDEQEIRQLIALHLKREGFAVKECGDGEAATQILSREKFDLVIVDWMLPNMSGLEIVRWMRKGGTSSRTPVLFVTAKAQPEQVAMALDGGADDYVTKPFDTLVLMARVNALLRRRQWLEEGQRSTPRSQIAFGELSLDIDSHEASLRNTKLDLTRSEFRLLQLLLENQGKVLSRQAIVDNIQGESVHVVGRTVDTHVFGLRKKLADYGDIVETIRGVGYRVRFLNPES
jgi:DNA-binding response OmpR family regulator